ncbi:MAG TPA: SRPBCC domain-containing protein [Candidatus Thermoplasmatota archaeon]|nr:SRPBCC domain-containing protein [Candidatus Thermoplasmatota archaeon]
MPRNVAPPASTLTLPSDTEIALVRSFAAPRELVWRAFTDPKLIPRWNGPAEPPMTVCEMDVRPNGKFRWGWGTAFETGGVFHQVEKPRLLVMESMFPDPTPEVRSHTFEERGGRTTVTIRIKTATKALRDELLASGAVEGLEPTYVRLDALLAGLA